jgi:SAM-dependent methyltransferase
MHRCNICNKEFSGPVQEARVRSNVRKFKQERFLVWRCPDCLSVHAAEDVDLAHYYRDYPFHFSGELDWKMRAVYRNQLRRLREAGLQPEHAVLDYGCGGGALVHFLREHGYANVSGYDQFSDAFHDRKVLEQRYDVIVTQDVLEHVAEPWTFLNTLSELLRPGGRVLIGTPNAEALDLEHPERRVHALHQPYHRHIFSKRMLLRLGDRLDWQLLRYYPTMYTNTLVPFVNMRFVMHYFRAGDDTVDLAFEPPQVGNLRLYNPLTLFWGLLGAFFSPETDVSVIYQKKS